MVRVETVAVDGTKLSANASPDANRTYASIRADAERFLRESAQVDAAEDELYGPARGDELPARAGRSGDAARGDPARQGRA